MHAYETRAYCCAQQTGMHILVVEALLVAIYSTGDEQILIHKRKPCRSRTCLVRIAGPCPAVPAPVQLYLSLSSCACPAGSCPAGSLSSWPIPAGVYEPANSHRNAAYSQQALCTYIDIHFFSGRRKTSSSISSRF